MFEQKKVYVRIQGVTISSQPIKKSHLNIVGQLVEKLSLIKRNLTNSSSLMSYLRRQRKSKWELIYETPIECGDRSHKNMEKALRIIGYSAHSGLPRHGPKAQVARWGLGEDNYPEGYKK